jgi:hypothetical protein
MEHELHNVNYIALEFTTQKNGVRGELVGLAALDTRSTAPCMLSSTESATYALIVRHLQHRYTVIMTMDGAASIPLP